MMEDRRMTADLIDVDFTGGIPARGISEDTCCNMGYGWSLPPHSFHVANLFDGPKLVAQKLRGADKKFSWRGDGKTDALFGAHRVGDRGRQIVVTEGEIDALSVAEVERCKWPVVSITKGAASAAKQIAANLSLFDGFERVVFMFDSDDAGRAGASAAAAVLPPGKAFIAALPLKDANEMLKAGRGHELPSLAWKARPWRPDGVISGLDLVDDVVALPEAGLSYPWPCLTDRLYGQRLGEIVMWTAGTGIGKTTAVRQSAYHLATAHGRRVGYIGLEETPVWAARQLVGIHMGKLLHVPSVQAAVAESEIRAAATEVLKDFEFYSHEGTFDWSALESKIRYWKHACDIEWVVLDHISFVLASTAAKGNAQTDELMTNLRLLAENLHIHLDVICHLRKTAGDARSFEEGGQISLDDLRGSGTLKTVPNIILGLERNQQAEGTDTRVRGLKDRFTGAAYGVLGTLRYDTDTGRYEEIDDTAAEMGQDRAADVDTTESQTTGGF